MITDYERQLECMDPERLVDEFVNATESMANEPQLIDRERYRFVKTAVIRRLRLAGNIT